MEVMLNSFGTENQIRKIKKCMKMKLLSISIILRFIYVTTFIKTHYVLSLSSISFGEGGWLGDRMGSPSPL